MTEPDNNAAVAEGPAISSPGKQLREAREARGMTVPETAVKLHLHQRMLTALETDDYDQLPSPIYVRGYLRNYARLLGLDSEQIVAAYDGSEEEHPELKPPLKAPNQASSSDKPVKAVTYLVTLVLVLLLLAWWQSRNISDESFMDLDELQVSETMGDSRQSTTEGGGEQVQSESLGYPIKVIRHPDTTYYPQPPRQQPQTTGTDTAAAEAAPTDTATTPAELLETMPDVDAGEAANSSEAPESAEPSATTAETDAGDEQQAEPAAADNSQGLRLELNRESWIEVYDAAGKRLYLGLGKPGEVIQVDGQAPLRVLLGYAPGVDVRYNGETINTIDHSRAGVAEFSVGG